MGLGLVTTDLHWPDSWQVVSRPNGPIAALSLLVEDPGLLDVLVGIEALTNPLAREAYGELATIPPERRYLGSKAGLVMTPFVIPRASRFSGGTFGMLYAGRAIETALHETGHYQALRLRATAAPAGFTVRMCSFSLDIASAAIEDIRWATGTSTRAIYDPDSYAASQAKGREIRADAQDGVLFDSVRYASGECAGLFWPDAIKSARDGDDWLFYFDGSTIAEFARAA